MRVDGQGRTLQVAEKTDVNRAQPHFETTSRGYFTSHSRAIENLLFKSASYMADGVVRSAN